TADPAAPDPAGPGTPARRLPDGWFRPDPAAAPPLRRVLAQARFDTRIMLSNGEQLLLLLILPALLLVGLALTHTPDLGAGRRIDVAAPGVLALALMSTAFTGQAIGTGFDRRYGVLRLLATTPLGRAGLLAGRGFAVLGLLILQTLVLGGLGLALGWRPVPAGLVLGSVGVLAGVLAFVSLGLLLAGTLRAEAVLAAANLVWVLLLAGGGVVLPPQQLGPLGGIARLLPSGALGDFLRTACLHGRADWTALVVLLSWGIVATAAAARWFRWD
ncbi:MAG TPA: ABC transporter permease, partial [Kineosporiaceae bacterium]|nr:ABC transporter permease [Kineosporiaceae bacterium]